MHYKNAIKLKIYLRTSFIKQLFSRVIGKETLYKSTIIKRLYSFKQDFSNFSIILIVASKERILSYITQISKLLKSYRHLQTKTQNITLI